MAKELHKHPRQQKLQFIYSPTSSNSARDVGEKNNHSQRLYFMMNRRGLGDRNLCVRIQKGEGAKKNIAWNYGWPINIHDSKLLSKDRYSRLHMIYILAPGSKTSIGTRFTKAVKLFQDSLLQGIVLCLSSPGSQRTSGFHYPTSTSGQLSGEKRVNLL